MKSLLRTFSLSTFAAFALGGFLQAITPEEAAEKVGETVTVTGVVTQASAIPSGSVYINFGEKYPNQILSVFVHKTNAEPFRELLPSLVGKSFTITGKVTSHNNKAEIQIKSPEELVETPPSAPSESSVTIESPTPASK